MYDIIIIGAGPAGLTAAIYARRAGKSVLVLEKDTFGGQMTYSPKIENYPGFTEIGGNALAGAMIDQAINLGAEIELGHVTKVSESGDIVTVTTEDGTNECHALIIAVGVKHRRLGVDGEDALVGHGISFCAVCDGAFYRDRDVIVIGGGNSALQEAILLSATSKSVTVLQNLDYFTGEAELVAEMESKANISSVTGAQIQNFSESDGRVTVHYSSSDEVRELTADGVFLAIGLVPENGMFADIASLDERGYIIADESCVVKPGIYAVGDCRTKRIRQISTAASDGAVAALAAIDYLRK